MILFYSSLKITLEIQMKSLVIFLAIATAVFFSVDLPQMTWAPPPVQGSALATTLEKEITFHTQSDGDIFMEEVTIKFPQEKPFFFIIKSHHGEKKHYTIGITDPTNFIGLTTLLREKNEEKKKQMEI